MSDRPYLVMRMDDIEPFTHPGDTGYHSQHVLGNELTGLHDTLVNRGVVEPHYALGGGNHPDNDEIYIALEGSCYLDLGGHPDTGEGSRAYFIEAGMTVFVPRGTFHRLRNEADAPFTLLTVWPQPAARGANGIHDLRLDTWGTGVRYRAGRELVTDDGAARVVDRGAGWDPAAPDGRG